MSQERATFADAYARALQSTNLRQEAHRISDPDLLLAFAMIDRKFAAPLYRSRVANDAAEVRKVRALWRSDVVRMAQNSHWTVKLKVRVEPGHEEVCDVLLPVVYAWAVADASLNAYMFDVCPGCQGRKFELLEGLDGEGRRVLSDKLCIACDGTGRAAPDIQPGSLLPWVDRAVEILRSRFDSFGRRAKARLRA